MIKMYETLHYLPSFFINLAIIFFLFSGQATTKKSDNSMKWHESSHFNVHASVHVCTR